MISLMFIVSFCISIILNLTPSKTLIMVSIITAWGLYIIRNKSKITLFIINRNAIFTYLSMFLILLFITTVLKQTGVETIVIYIALFLGISVFALIYLIALVVMSINLMVLLHRRKKNIDKRVKFDINTFALELISEYNYYVDEKLVKNGKLIHGNYITIKFDSNIKIYNYNVIGEKKEGLENILILKLNQKLFDMETSLFKVNLSVDDKRRIVFIQIKNDNGFLRKYDQYETRYDFKIRCKQRKSIVEFDFQKQILKNHYYVNENGKKIREIVVKCQNETLHNKSILINSKQGIGKTMFLKKLCFDQMKKPISISIWNEGKEDDPLSIIANNIDKNLTIDEKIKYKVRRLNFSIFFWISIMFIFSFAFKELFEILKKANENGIDMWNQWQEAMSNDIIVKNIIITIGIWFIMGLCLYAILNYIELNLILYKTSNTTNDRTKFLDFIKVAMKDKVLILEDFERLDSLEKIDSWITEVDALNHHLEYEGINIIITYDKEEIVIEQKDEKEKGIFKKSVKKRILCNAEELKHDVHINEYIILLNDLEKNEEYLNCIDFRDINLVKNGMKSNETECIYNPSYIINNNVKIDISYFPKRYLEYCYYWSDEDKNQLFDQMSYVILQVKELKNDSLEEEFYKLTSQIKIMKEENEPDLDLILDLPEEDLYDVEDNVRKFIEIIAEVNKEKNTNYSERFIFKFNTLYRYYCINKIISDKIWSITPGELNLITKSIIFDYIKHEINSTYDILKDNENMLICNDTKVLYNKSLYLFYEMILDIENYKITKFGNYYRIIYFVTLLNFTGNYSADYLEQYDLMKRFLKDKSI